MPLFHAHTRCTSVEPLRGSQQFLRQIEREGVEYSPVGYGWYRAGGRRDVCRTLGTLPLPRRVAMMAR